MCFYCYNDNVFYEENLALGKSVWENLPRFDRLNWRADNAVDGRYDNRSAAGGQCAISRSYSQAAILRVDLGVIVNIDHINLYYRTDNLPRMILLSNFHLVE